MMRARGQSVAALAVTDQIAESPFERTGVIRRNEGCRALPVLAKARYIPQHQRAAGESGFEDRKAERFIFCGQAISRYALPSV